MQPEDRDAALIWDMWQATNDVLAFVEGMRFAEFEADKRTRFAVERQLMVVGEAAGRVSRTLQEAHPELPWRRVIGLRNVLAHDYGEILVERIWIVVQDHVPDLRQNLAALLPDEPATPS